jgi:ribosomal protein S18 acetylase RimI-like enzyme
MPQDCAVIRHLRVDEAPMLARLRATSFGQDQTSDDDIARTARLLAEHLASGDFVCVVAVDQADVVSYGVGMIHQRLPVPRNPSGRWGYIQSMETHPQWRRRGLARGVLDAMLTWFQEHQITGVSLVSSADGEPLYRQAGFTADPFGQSLIRICPASAM